MFRLKDLAVFKSGRTMPESRHALIENCSDEIVDGPFIQSAAGMRAVTDRFAPNQNVMNALLEQWFTA